MTHSRKIGSEGSRLGSLTAEPEAGILGQVICGVSSQEEWGVQDRAGEGNKKGFFYQLESSLSLIPPGAWSMNSNTELPTHQPSTLRQEGSALCPNISQSLALGCPHSKARISGNSSSC